MISSLTRKIVGELLCDDEEIISERQSRSETAEERGKKYTFHGYLMKGDLDVAKEAVEKEFISILTKLAEVLKDRFSCFLEDSTFHAMATFLDTKAFVHTDVSDIYEAVNVIWDKFYYLLKENGCEKENLKNELRTLCSHVKTVFKTSSASRCWPKLFQRRDSLNITNILHIAELCIAIPLSNAECERVFSFLWKLYSKERHSLSHNTLERLL